jgi:hypothetical protein
MTTMKELANELGIGKLEPWQEFDLTKFAHSASEASRVLRILDKDQTRKLIETFKVMRKLLRKKMKHNAAFRTVSHRKWAGHKNNKPKYNWSKRRRRQGGWRA